MRRKISLFSAVIASFLWFLLGGSAIWITKYTWIGKYIRPSTWPTYFENANLVVLGNIVDNTNQIQTVSIGPMFNILPIKVYKGVLKSEKIRAENKSILHSTIDGFLAHDNLETGKSAIFYLRKDAKENWQIIYYFTPQAMVWPPIPLFVEGI